MTSVVQYLDKPLAVSIHCVIDLEPALYFLIPRYGIVVTGVHTFPSAFAQRAANLNLVDAMRTIVSTKSHQRHSADGDLTNPLLRRRSVTESIESDRGSDELYALSMYEPILPHTTFVELRLYSLEQEFPIAALDDTTNIGLIRMSSHKDKTKITRRSISSSLVDPKGVQYATLELLSPFFPEADPEHPRAQTFRTWHSRRRVVLATCSATAFIIFALNLTTLIVFETRWRSLNGIGTLFSGNCTRAQQLDSGLHVVIKF